MTCRECEREITNGVTSVKDIKALNKKLLGRHIKSFLCEKCLAEYLDISVDDLPEMIEGFKELGCALF